MLQPHTFGTSSVGTKMSANMERVQAVTDHIDRNLGEKLRVEQLAEVADCSLRTLQLTIAELFGMTVVEFVRSRRLKEARRLLEAGDAGATVTDIGNRIGLSQLGRFSSDYRATYGESPSETLKMGQTKRARGRIGGSPT
jgi:transcriptional regulator GlxA family with amidase domain